MKKLGIGMLCTALVVAGCSAAPSNVAPLVASDVVRENAPNDLPKVRLMFAERELPSIVGSYCWSSHAGTEKCVDAVLPPDLVKGKEWTPLSPLTKLRFYFSEAPANYTVTKWQPHPTMDPAPGHSVPWVQSPVILESGSTLRLPEHQASGVYEVYAEWQQGGSASYFFPIEVPSGPISLAELKVEDMASVTVRSGKNEVRLAPNADVLRPVVDAYNAAKYARQGIRGTTPADSNVLIQLRSGKSISLDYVKGSSSVPAVVERWNVWFDSEALSNALEQLRQSVISG